MLQQVELLLGSIGVILGFFFAAFLIATHKKYRFANVYLAIYLLAFGLRIGKSLFHNYFELNASLRTFLLATLLAIPVAYWLSERWLNNFDLRIEPSLGLHLLALPVCLLFTAMSVSYHSLKAARSNPIDALRME